jgi:hypothetical protein
MSPVDITHLTYPELAQLREEVQNRMAEMRETGIHELRSHLNQQAAVLGIQLKDLLPKRGRRRKKLDHED